MGRTARKREGVYDCEITSCDAVYDISIKELVEEANRKMARNLERIGK